MVCQGHNDNGDVAGFIRRLSKNAQKKTEETFGRFDKTKLPTTKDVKYLSNLLRGDFDKASSINRERYVRWILMLKMHIPGLLRRVELN